MAGIERSSRLKSVNGIDCAGLVTGVLEDLKANGLEKGLVMGFVKYLSRSSGSLRSLDLRCTGSLI